MAWTSDQTMLTVLAVTCAGLAASVVIVCFIYWQRHKRKKEKEYVQIGGLVSEKKMELQYVQSQGMPAIPFTVPGGLKSKEVSPSQSQDFPSDGSSSHSGTNSIENSSTVSGDSCNAGVNSTHTLGGATNLYTGPASTVNAAAATAAGLGTVSRRISIDSICSIDPRAAGGFSLGTIDPSLYKNVNEEEDYEVDEDHIGRLWFAVEYEGEAERLLVTVIKCRKLPSRTFGSSNACDPFVRIHLMPDERRYLQTKLKKKTCNPKFDERFVFQVSSKCLKERALKFTVYDVDRYRKHHVIGHVLYPLKDQDYQSNDKVVIWRDLEKAVSETVSEKGELHISLSYNSQHERITVGVYEGKHFWKPDSGASQAFYLKISLHMQSKVLKTKRTDVVRKTSDPAFNESFTFKLAPSALDAASVSVVAMQYIIGHRDKQVGRLGLGSFMFARGKELSHWNEMVANQKQQISNWHKFT